eukprot:tig00000949_g5750.t1
MSEFFRGASGAPWAGHWRAARQPQLATLARTHPAASARASRTASSEPPSPKRAAPLRSPKKPAARVTVARRKAESKAEFDGEAARRFLAERCELDEAQIARLLAKKPRLLDFEPRAAGHVVGALEAIAAGEEAAGEGPEGAALKGDEAGPTGAARAALARAEAAKRGRRLRVYAEAGLVRMPPAELEARLAAWREAVGAPAVRAIVRKHPALLGRLGEEGIRGAVERAAAAGFTPEQLAEITRANPNALNVVASMRQRVERVAAALGLAEAEVRAAAAKKPYPLGSAAGTLDEKMALLESWGLDAGERAALAGAGGLSGTAPEMQATYELLRDQIFGGDAARALRTLTGDPTLLNFRAASVEERARGLAEALGGPGAPLSTLADLVCGSTLLHRRPEVMAARVQGLRAMGVSAREIGRERALFSSSWEARVVPRLVARRLLGLEGRFKSASSLVKKHSDEAFAERVLGLPHAAWRRLAASCGFLLRAGVPAPALYGLPLAALDAGPEALAGELDAFRAAGGSEGAAFAARLADRYRAPAAAQPRPPDAE